MHVKFSSRRLYFMLVDVFVLLLLFWDLWICIMWIIWSVAYDVGIRDQLCLACFLAFLLAFACLHACFCLAFLLPFCLRWIAPSILVRLNGRFFTIIMTMRGHFRHARRMVLVVVFLRAHLTVETAHPRIVLVSTIKSVVSTPGSQRDNYSS